MRHIKMIFILFLYAAHLFFICIPLFLSLIIGLEIIYTLKFLYERITTTDKNPQAT